MKKFLVLCLAALTAISLTACGTSSASDEASGSSEVADAQVANPFTEYDTVSEASDAAGFTLDALESIGTYGNVTYRVMNAGKDDAMIEVVYRAQAADADDSEASENEYVVRKAAGSEDVSGDYNDYAETWTVDTDKACYTFSGDGDAVSLITWESDGYSFSLGAYGGATLSADDATSLVERIY